MLILIERRSGEERRHVNIPVSLLGGDRRWHRDRRTPEDRRDEFDEADRGVIENVESDESCVPQ